MAQGKGRKGSAQGKRSGSRKKSTSRSSSASRPRSRKQTSAGGTEMKQEETQASE